MDIKFPFNRDVEQAHEKILQAGSAREISDLLKRDDPRKPYFQEALVRLVSGQIMKQFTPEEIAKVENTPQNAPTFGQTRSFELMKHRGKTDNSASFAIVNDAAASMNLYENRYSPVSTRIVYAALDFIKDNPRGVELIFDDILPKIKQDQDITTTRTDTAEISEQAREKILQAGSAREISDLLKRDDPRKPDFQEALIRLVSGQIMKQFTPEEIARVESLSPHKLTPYPRPEDRGRSTEIMKLASRMDNTISFSIVTNASQKHDPFMIKKKYRGFIEPEKSVAFSINNAVLEHIKNYPGAVEQIFDDILPEIKRENALSREKTVNAKSFEREIETAKKAGYVQGVCECVAAIGDNRALGKKLLSEMNVNRDMAEKYANPETFKVLEQGIFARKQEQQPGQTRGVKR
jgi:hypothetical protein